MTNPKTSVPIITIKIPVIFYSSLDSNIKAIPTNKRQMASPIRKIYQLNGSFDINCPKTNAPIDIFPISVTKFATRAFCFSFSLISKRLYRGGVKLSILLLILLVAKPFAESSLSLSPSTITAYPKERISLSLNAEDIKDAICIQLDVSFDPSIIEIESVEKDMLFSWLIWMKGTESIRIISGVSLGSLPISGTGTICKLSFITNNLGTTSIFIKNPYVIKQDSEEIPKTLGSTITVRLGEPYLRFETISTQKTHTPFPITIYAIDPYGEPMSLTSTIALDDYTHTIEGSLTFNGTYTKGTVSISSVPNRGINRITAKTDGISGISNPFLIFASDPFHHKIDIPTDSGTITCDIDPSTIGEDYYIDIAEDITGTVTLLEGNVGLGLSIDVYTEEGEISGEISPFKVEIPYREEDLGNINEATLRLYTLIDRWQITRDSGVDTQNNICYGWISHLSYFCIAGSVTTHPLFWPNPYYPNIHKEIRFSSKIKSARVFNIKGELVDTTEKKTYIPNLSSGVYIIILEDTEGRRYIRRLGIIR